MMDWHQRALPSGSGGSQVSEGVAGQDGPSAPDPGSRVASPPIPEGGLLS